MKNKQEGFAVTDANTPARHTAIEISSLADERRWISLNDESSWR